MKTKLSQVTIRSLFLLLALSPVPCALCPMPFALSQVPQGFNYQAIARTSSGDVIQNYTFPHVVFDIQTSTGTIQYEETFTSVLSNTYGLITLAVGTGTRNISYGTFAAINWKQPLYLKTIIEYPGTTMTTMGVSQIWAVPYSLMAKDVTGPLTNLGISATATTMNSDSTLFEVKNQSGQTVFAVYDQAVRMYVSKGTKGQKGGFAVGGFGTDKGTSQKYMIISSDSARIYIDSNPATKGAKGGFAVGGYDITKGTISSYLNVQTDTTYLVNPADNRIYFYPLKNAFLTGRVWIKSRDSVGINSFSSGYESRAKGNWSQALGYKTAARGDYSTAIGKNALANAPSSFAFGDGAAATGNGSYAFGTGAAAKGALSFALGSVGVDSLGHFTGNTIASGYGSFAAGFGSVASAQGAFTFGVADTAKGLFSTAMGYQTVAMGPFGTSMGLWTVDSAWASTTTGWGTTVGPSGWCGMANGCATRSNNWTAAAFGDRTYAGGHTSFATGYKSTASGHISSAFGEQTVAPSRDSYAIGAFNSYSGTTDSWNLTDPLFMIGYGTSTSDRRNALTVYKSGNMDLAGTLNKTLISQNSVLVNYGGSGNRSSYFSLLSDDTNPYGFEIYRSNGGTSAYTCLYHRGTGPFYIYAIDAAPITLITSSYERMRITSGGYVGIGTASPSYLVDVAGNLNLNKGISSGQALFVNSKEALWFNGTYFSWGYQGNYNVFASSLSVGTTDSPGTYGLYVAGNVYATGGWAGSDARWKKDIEPLQNLLPEVMKLQGIKYDWRTDEYPKMNFDKTRQIGLIAQDVEKIFPELVKTNNDGYKAISYEKLTVVLLEGMKEQQQQIESQQKQIDDLKELVVQLQPK